MILLHNKKGGISGQIQKNLQGEDIALIGNNINQTTGTAWQALIKFRDTRQSFPAVFGYALCLHDTNSKEPFYMEMSESEARQKLKAWNYPTIEIENLLKMEVE